jgi:hypothetical protein
MAQSPTTTSTSTTTKSDPRVAQDADTPLQRSARDEPHGSEERDHEHEFTRAEWERAKENTDPERRGRIREVLSQTLLPGLPKREGWHRCWVSTTHPSDTPHRRQQLGYRFVMYDDVREAGWASDQNAVKDGAGKGAVMWREMVAMEVPNRDFLEIMRELHHDAPRDMARGITDGLEELAANAKEKGGRVTLDSGFGDLGEFVRPPRQFES